MPSIYYGRSVTAAPREPATHPRLVPARNFGFNRSRTPEAGSSGTLGMRFLVVGAWNTGFGYALFAALYLAFGDHVHYLGIAAFTMVIAVLQAFVLYRVWVFRTRGPWLAELRRFVAVYAGAFCLNLVLLPLLVDVASIPVLLAQCIALVTVVAFSFFGHREFSFADR